MFSYCKNKNQLIGFISDCEDGFKLFVVDSVSEEKIWTRYYEIKEAKVFIEKFTNDIYGCNIFKAFIVDVFGLNFGSTPFGISYNFCEALKEKFQEFKIPFYFITRINYLFSIILASLQIGVKVDETIAIVMPYKNNLTVGEFKFTSNGYELVEKKYFKFDIKAKPEILKRQILGNSTPKKLIFAQHGCKKFPHKKVFKSMKFFICGGCLVCHPEKFMTETCKWILDKAYVRYYILPTAVKSLHVYGYYGAENKILDILHIKKNDPLPISKTLFVTKSVPVLHVVYEDNVTIFSRTEEWEKNCHKYKVTFTADENNFSHFKTEKFILPNFENFPSKIKVLSETKLPFIGFFDNSSVIAVHKDPKGYQFLKEWNGKYGEEMYISFDKQKPQFGKAAMDVLKRKHTFVVFDLLKIMSMPSDNIQVSKHWGFKITKDASNPVLIDFNNFCGARRAASPSFIMALFLRQQLKVIEKEIGEKPSKIALWILEDFEEDEMERIKNGIGEACKLLKVEFVFADSEKSKFFDF